MRCLVCLSLAVHLSCAISTRWATAMGKDGAGPWAAVFRAQLVSCEKHPEWLVGCACPCGDVNASCLTYLYKVLSD